MYFHTLFFTGALLLTVKQSYQAILPAKIPETVTGCTVRKEFHAVNTTWTTPNGRKECRCNVAEKVVCEKVNGGAKKQKDSCKVPMRHVKLIHATPDKKGELRLGEEVTLTCRRGHSPIHPGKKSIQLTCGQKNLAGQLNKSGFSCRKNGRKGKAGKFGLFCKIPKSELDASHAKLVHPKKKSLRSEHRGPLKTYKIPLGQKLIVKCKPSFKPASETDRKFVAKCQKGAKLSKKLADSPFSCVPKN